MVTPRHEHIDEVTRLDVGQLNSFIRVWKVNLGYTITRLQLYICIYTVLGTYFNKSNQNFLIARFRNNEHRLTSTFCFQK